MTPEKEAKLFWYFAVAALVIITAGCVWELFHGRGFVV